MHPAAWHPDPLGRHEYRYWDGERWTDHVADAGQVGIDPLEAALAAGAGPTSGDPDGSRSVAGAHAASTPVGPVEATPPTASSWPAATPVAATPTTGTNGVAVAAMVIGILSLMVAWFPLLGLLGGLGGLVAVILGFVGRKRARAGGPSGGMAVTGIVTGFVAMALATLVTVLLFSFGGEFIRQYEADYEACMTEFGDDAYCQDEVGRSFVERWMR